MNDDELAAAVREAVRGAHMNIPAGQIVHRSRAIRARRRISGLVGGLTAAAAAAAAAGLVLALGPAAPGQHAAAGHDRTVVTAAWTVRVDADRTVTIYLRRYAHADVSGLQLALRADGVNAIARSTTTVTRTVGKVTVMYPACTWRSENGAGPVPDRAPPAVQQAVGVNAAHYSPSRGLYFVVHTSAMPHGSALFIGLTDFGPVKTRFGERDDLAWDFPVVLNNDTVPACVPMTPSPNWFRP